MNKLVPKDFDELIKFIIVDFMVILAKKKSIRDQTQEFEKLVKDHLLEYISNKSVKVMLKYDDDEIVKIIREIADEIIK